MAGQRANKRHAGASHWPTFRARCSGSGDAFRTTLPAARRSSAIGPLWSWRAARRCSGSRPRIIGPDAVEVGDAL